jgi:folate-binding protein YgfZ
MLSNRVEDLRPGEGVYSTFLTRQGKFVADLHLYRRTDCFKADLAPGMASVFSEVIDMYIIMDQVEVEDLTASQASLGLFGPNSLKMLKNAGLDPGDLPEHGHIDIEGMTIAQEPWTGDEGYLLSTPSDNAESTWDALLGAGATPTGLTAFETLTLEAGTPLFGLDMNSDLNPMQAGLETKAIDFDKGCYIGQEVIAKIKYLGQVNRGLCGIRLSGEQVPPAGAKVEANGEEVGTLTRAAYCPTEAQTLAFALLHRKAMDTGCQVTVLDGEVSFAGEVAPLPFYKN